MAGALGCAAVTRRGGALTGGREGDENKWLGMHDSEGNDTCKIDWLGSMAGSQATAGRAAARHGHGSTSDTQGPQAHKARNATTARRLGATERGTGVAHLGLQRRWRFVTEKQCGGGASLEQGKQRFRSSSRRRCTAAPAGGLRLRDERRSLGRSPHLLLLHSFPLTLSAAGLGRIPKLARVRARGSRW
jgi:hypothetical protein